MLPAVRTPPAGLADGRSDGTVPGRPWRVALYTDRPGWHCRRLRRAFEARGCIVQDWVPQLCGFDLDQPQGVYGPDRSGRLPDAVFVRSIPAGSFEAITLRLSLLHALADLGVLVYNPAALIERTVDKARTSFLLHRAGLPTPPTWVGESHDDWLQRLHDARTAGRSLVSKPLFGAEGEGLQRIDPQASWIDSADSEARRLQTSPGGVHYLQCFLDGRGGTGRAEDCRVLVVGGRARVAMTRRVAARAGPDAWITNVARGGESLPCALTPALARLAEEACRALVGTGPVVGHYGVDVLTDRQGQSWVLEVNSVPAWRGLQSVTGQDLAALLADDVLQCLVERSAEGRGRPE